MDRTVHTAVPVDHTTQWIVPDQVVAMHRPAAVPEVLLADEEHVVQPGPLPHMVLQDHTVPQDHMVLPNLSVRPDLMDHLKRRVADLQVAAQLVVLHELPVVLMAPLAQLLLSVQPVLTDLIRQVGLTAGNFCCGVTNDTVKWKLEIRKRQLVTSNSG